MNATQLTTFFEEMFEVVKGDAWFWRNDPASPLAGGLTVPAVALVVLADLMQSARTDASWLLVPVVPRREVRLTRDPNFEKVHLTLDGISHWLNTPDVETPRQLYDETVKLLNELLMPQEVTDVRE